MPFLDAPKPLATTDKLAVYGGPDTGDQDALYVFPLASALAGTLPAPVLASLPNGPQRRFTHKAAEYQNASSVGADGYFVGNGCSDLGCGFDVLNIQSIPGLEQGNYADEMHVNASGVPIYTRYLVSKLKQ